MKKVLAIIPARGGSKRIPHKNTKLFCGKPIIAYSIEAALQSKLFAEVMVSTDNESIKKIAVEYGASVPFLRSTANADDFATTADVVLEVLKQYHAIEKQFNHLAIIYPTAPFVTPTKLISAYKKVIEYDAHSLVSIVKYGFPIQRSLMSSNGFISFKWPEHMNTRSQDLEPTYHDAGQFYLLKTDAFLTEKKLFTTKTLGFELSETEVQDIDTLTDWELAELKFKRLRNE